jgi:hypothetical protein
VERVLACLEDVVSEYERSSASALMCNLIVSWLVASGPSCGWLVFLFAHTVCKVCQIKNVHDRRTLTCSQTKTSRPVDLLHGVILMPGRMGAVGSSQGPRSWDFFANGPVI